MHTTLSLPSSRCGLAALVATAIATTVVSPAAVATVIYNPQSGNLPSAQGWLTLCPAPACSQSVEVDVVNTYLFSTQALGNAVQAGHGRVDLALNTVSGYQIDWQMQVLGESHANSNRAGFSVLAVGSDVTQAIEIAFWTDQVWAYTYDNINGFTRGTQAAFNTTSGLHNYSLNVQGGNYTLHANGNLLFNGALNNYSASGIQPYGVANTLFWGDDTGSASASVAMRSMQFSALSPVPEPAPLWLAALGMLAVVGQTRRLASPRGR